ncbi:hypothetical protein RN001_003656 [Aquatica leii]|uniref:YqaJ viral recombinase domain-containing protein n=1 Tax=Aquatica leii TaxID=1421715 RepID=A0AAN7ST25_9COLE|nr:hypothetical protein RN001_003656 [Aquatica leii]
MVEEGIIPLPEDKIQEFISGLSLTNTEIIELKRKTRGQSCNLLWKAERSNRLTASNFGRMCRKRETTNSKNIINSIINSAFIGSVATRWASPDGIIDENTIVEIKCPYSAAQLSIAEAVSSKKSSTLQKIMKVIIN